MVEVGALLFQAAKSEAHQIRFDQWSKWLYINIIYIYNIYISIFLGIPWHPKKTTLQLDAFLPPFPWGMVVSPFPSIKKPGGFDGFFRVSSVDSPCR